MRRIPGDPAMENVRKAWAARQQAGWTMQKLGEAMGYAPASARKHVHQFMKTRDPQISMLRRFAKAIGMSIPKLVS